jgi:hypothetical protein
LILANRESLQGQERIASQTTRIDKKLDDLIEKVNKLKDNGEEK